MKNYENKYDVAVILIVRNEEKNISKCLESVSWASEIIIVDSGSNDNTINICLEYTRKVYQETNWQGFGIQKNRALSYATKQWVLSIDADERVSPELKNEILDAISHPQYTAWSIPRSSSYCGRFMKHGGWWPDRVVRLFKRDSARFSDDLVHERLIVTQGQIGNLNAPLLHYSYINLEEVIDKINIYSSASAQQKFEQGASKVGLHTAILHGIWSFLRTYFFRMGCLDGREGFMLAVSNAEHTYYRYLKLMYLQENRIRK